MNPSLYNEDAKTLLEHQQVSQKDLPEVWFGGRFIEIHQTAALLTPSHEPSETSDPKILSIKVTRPGKPASPAHLYVFISASTKRF